MKTVATLVLLFVAPYANAQPATFDAVKARQTVDGLNKKWSQARIAYDKATIDAMLGADFTVKIGDRTMTREEYFKSATDKGAGPVFKRFDVEVLTVQPGPDGSIHAIFKEKLELERTMADGKTQTIYSVQVGRDTWKENASGWQVVASETHGWEFWRGQKPPASVWD